MSALLKAALVSALAIAWLLWEGAPLVPERAERAALAPLLVLAATVILFSRARTRSVARLLGKCAAGALAAAVTAHVLAGLQIKAPLRPVEVSFTALFYLGPLSAIAFLGRLVRSKLGRLAGLVAVLALALVYLPGKVLMHRPKLTAAAELDVPAAAPREEVALRTRDGLTLWARFYPAPAPVAAFPEPAARAEAAARAPRRTPAVILCHGVGADSVGFAYFAELVRGFGYSVLAPDLRGHGRSEGHTQTYGVRERADIAAALEWLRARPDVDPSRIAIYGHSMGAVISLLAAAEFPEIRGVVADAGYADLAEMAAQKMRFRILPPAVGRALSRAALLVTCLETGIHACEASPLAALPRIAPRPILLIHGLADTATPPEHSRRLFEAAPGPKELYLMPGVSHDRIAGDVPPDYGKRLAAFFARTFGG